jgi:predicted GNAT superfamily acetyltransferase
MQEVLAINNAAVPNVNRLDLKELEELRNMAGYFRVSETNSEISGFLIALQPAAEYHSENFQWFRQHYDEFVYIDRVVVAQRFRGLGVGRVFYADVQSHAEQLAPLLTCEVNLVPRNDVSLLFHGTNGFHEVGQLSSDSGEKAVSLQAKELSAYEFVRVSYGT